MNIKEIESYLKLENIFFSKCVVERNEKLSTGKLNIDISKDITPLDNHKYKIVITVTINKEDLNVEVEAVSVFFYSSDNYEDEEYIINHNTVAIVFPFIRSQVTLLTSQPNMQPIVLPPINTENL